MLVQTLDRACNPRQSGDSRLILFGDLKIRSLFFRCHGWILFISFVQFKTRISVAVSSEYIR